MAGGRDQLKRLFTGITLTTNDLKTIAARAEEIAPTVAMKANAYRLSDIDQLTDVVAEDVVIDHLTVMVFDAGGAALEVTWEPSFVLVQADDGSPAVRAPFSAIVALLESRPRNGFNYNVIEISPAGTWTAPSPAATSTTASAAPAPATSLTGPTNHSSAGFLSRWWKRLSQPQTKNGTTKR